MKIEQTHSGQTFVYAGSITLERAAYYGMRSILLLYMVKQLQMPQMQAVTIYTFFIGMFLLSSVVGALLGDLLLGNKNALLIGGLIQTIGCFVIAVPVEVCLYSGMGLIVIGGGMYNSNSPAKFGKFYLNKPHLLDGAFMIFYTGINVGAFLGAFCIGQLGDINYSLGFGASGFIMLLSIALPFLIKETASENETVPAKSVSGENIAAIAISLILIGIFWGVYEFAGNGTFEIQYKIEQYFSGSIPSSVWTMFAPAFVVMLGLVLSIVWSLFYQSRLMKLMIGFLAGAVSFGLLLIIPVEVGTSSGGIFIFSALMLTIAELFLAPIILSVLTVHANPKYLALIISLSFLPGRLLSYLLMMSMNYFGTDSSISLKIGTAIFALFTIILVVLFVAIGKKKENPFL